MVLGIIGILSSAIIFVINPVLQIKKGRDTTRKADLNNIRTSLEIYRQAEGRYPPEPLECDNVLEADGVVYMNRVPCDPQGGNYVYSVDPNAGVVYSIYACLENEDDPDIAPESERAGLCDTAFILRNP